MDAFRAPRVDMCDFDMADRVVSVLTKASENNPTQWRTIRWTFIWGSEWSVSADVWSVRGWLTVWTMPAHGDVLSGDHKRRAQQITDMLRPLAPYVNRVLS